MKLNIKKTIDYASVDSASTLTLHSYVKLFQEASIRHSNRLGTGSEPLPEGMALVLYQYGIKVDHYPKYRDNIEIITWIRKIQGYKIYREFDVYSGSKKIASASAVYLLYDVINRRIWKIPDQTAAFYPVLQEKGYPEDLDQWRPVLKFVPGFETDMNTRISDYDPMNHVNNASYFDIVETLLFRYLKNEMKIKDIKITFTREMDKSVNRFRSGLLKDGDVFRFKIENEKILFSYGELTQFKLSK